MAVALSSDGGDDTRRQRARLFFERAQVGARTGNLDFAIEYFLSAIDIDPDFVEAHQSLREVSLQRKAAGGQSLGMFETMKLRRPVVDDKAKLVRDEKLLAYEPGNIDHANAILAAAQAMDLAETRVWAAALVERMRGEH